ncbi:Cytochrome c domain-containing protein [Candidatus Nitrotoga sp. HW29]|uniref:c-type cytochrome n=1 Tax=Candidatus Nitrotoga sp. HW29 TaxID=2886963 RepID=UPI001EF20D58|nr:cytochrome c [Candidatus Nitrotoga sp. HW29]CAH1905147.1 Cytochrome c domain-containing protein [Candidatus Nitrotoga sp. HW29]
MSNLISRNFQNIFLIFVAICGTVCLPALAFSQSNIGIEFKDKDQIVKVLTLSDLTTEVTAVSLKIFEIHEKKDQIYKVYPARALFDKTFGKEWLRAEEIVFISMDGYQASIPVAKFLSYDAYFAFAHDDDSLFTMTNVLQNNEVVQLGPLYLVWDNMKSKVLLEDGASDMPYQVRSIELTKFATRFPNLSPPAKASAEVQRGFLHFRKYCMACHLVNGEGGGKAPELNYPISVVEYIKPEYLTRWIENPSSVRHNTLMPGLAQEIPDRAKVIKEIIAYLKAMSTTKRNPKN